jgi:hypothetical protein
VLTRRYARRGGDLALSTTVGGGAADTFAVLDALYRLVFAQRVAGRFDIDPSLIAGEMIADEPANRCPAN